MKQVLITAIALLCSSQLAEAGETKSLFKSIIPTAVVVEALDIGPSSTGRLTRIEPAPRPHTASFIANDPFEYLFANGGPGMDGVNHCTADCGDGTAITCSGEHCIAAAGRCNAWDADNTMYEWSC